MNQPPQTFSVVQEERLLAFVQACLEEAGLATDHAQTSSRLLVNSDLRGVRSHGFRYIGWYCRLLRDGQLNPRPDVRVVHRTPTAAVLDGDGGLGYHPMVRATEEAIAIARKVGIGMGLVRHIAHYGAAGHYTRMCLEAGCIGISSQGFRREAQPRPDQPRPSSAWPGWPPLSVSVPAGEERDIVLDMVAHALSGYQGEAFADLPERVPAAFFKSLGLVAVSNVLGGALAGITLPQADAAEERWRGAWMGGMILAIHVESVVPMATFSAEVDRYARALCTGFDPLPGFERTMMPGQVEAETAQRYRAEGIHLGPEEQDAARTLSKDLGVPLPWD